MLKNIARFEHKVGERIYHFICDHDAPLGEVHDALARFKSQVVSMITAAEQKSAETPAPKTE